MMLLLYEKEIIMDENTMWKIDAIVTYVCSAYLLAVIVTITALLLH